MHHYLWCEINRKNDAFFVKCSNVVVAQSFDNRVKGLAIA